MNQCRQWGLSVRTGAVRMSLAVLAGAGLLAQSPARAAEDLEAQVWQTECRFAASMAARDPGAFAAHLAEQAVFMSANEALRGSAAVQKGWASYFEGASPPFSWAPDRVIVLEDGQLAWSTGLVRGPDGRAVARFNSVWRREADGRWRIVLDKGSPLSRAEEARAAESDARPCAAIKP